MGNKNLKKLIIIKSWQFKIYCVYFGSYRCTIYFCLGSICCFYSINDMVSLLPSERGRRGMAIFLNSLMVISPLLFQLRYRMTFSPSPCLIIILAGMSKKHKQRLCSVAQSENPQAQFYCYTFIIGFLINARKWTASQQWPHSTPRLQSYTGKLTV